MGASTAVLEKNRRYSDLKTFYNLVEEQRQQQRQQQQQQQQYN